MYNKDEKIIHAGNLNPARVNREFHRDENGKKRQGQGWGRFSVPSRVHL